MKINRMKNRIEFLNTDQKELAALILKRAGVRGVMLQLMACDKNLNFKDSGEANYAWETLLDEGAGLGLL